MWYFLIRQDVIDMAQYQSLQKQASFTEVEAFSEPYDNWYVFSVEKGHYPRFMDHLDREGVPYELTANRPTRDELMASMR